MPGYPAAHRIRSEKADLLNPAANTGRTPQGTVCSAAAPAEEPDTVAAVDTRHHTVNLEDTRNIAVAVAAVVGKVCRTPHSPLPAAAAQTNSTAERGVQLAALVLVAKRIPSSADRLVRGDSDSNSPVAAAAPAVADIRLLRHTHTRN